MQGWGEVNIVLKIISDFIMGSVNVVVNVQQDCGSELNAERIMFWG